MYTASRQIEPITPSITLESTAKATDPSTSPNCPSRIEETPRSHSPKMSDSGSGDVPSRLATASMVPKMTLNQKVKINIGGQRHETFLSTLHFVKDTRLSWLANADDKSADQYDPVNDEYFFDRNPIVFPYIIDFYRTGKLHMPPGICGPLFEQELEYWGIDEKSIEPCCWQLYVQHKDAEIAMKNLQVDDDYFNDMDDTLDTDEEQIRLGQLGTTSISNDNEKEKQQKSQKIIQINWARCRRRIWYLMEKPDSQMDSKIYTAVTVILSIVYVLLLCTETMLPQSIQGRRSRTDNVTELTVNLQNELTCATLNPLTKHRWFYRHFTESDRVETWLTLQEYGRILEEVLSLLLALELIMRFIVCPAKHKFFTQFYNICDILSLIPPIYLVISSALWDKPVPPYISIIKTFRIFRLVRSARNMTGLQILLHTLKASAQELLLYLALTMLAVLLFASLMFYAEQIGQESDCQRNDFTSIPQGFWWAIITMTTTGYGDMYPRTVTGYLVGFATALAGVLALALPVPVIVNNFQLYYSHAMAKKQLPTKTTSVLINADDAFKSAAYHQSSGSGTNRRDSSKTRLSMRRNTMNATSVKTMYDNEGYYSDRENDQPSPYTADQPSEAEERPYSQEGSQGHDSTITLPATPEPFESSEPTIYNGILKRVSSDTWLDEKAERKAKSVRFHRLSIAGIQGINPTIRRGSAISLSNGDASSLRMVPPPVQAPQLHLVRQLTQDNVRNRSISLEEEETDKFYPFSISQPRQQTPGTRLKTVLEREDPLMTHSNSINSILSVTHAQ